MNKRNSHLGSRLSLSSEQLKNATLQINNGNAITESPAPGAPADPLAEGEATGDSGPDTSLPEAGNDMLPSDTLAIGDSDTYVLMPIAGQIEKISSRDWQSLSTFLNGGYILDGKIAGDVVKLTPGNHEFLKKLKFFTEMDMSFFVNMLLELFRRRFQQELPKLPSRVPAIKKP